MANILKFLEQSSVVFRYTENALRGQIVEGVVSSTSGLALPAVVDSTQAGVLYAGDPVSLVATSTGTGHFVKATNPAAVVGFVSYETKKIAYKAGDVFTLASTGKVMHMVTETALTAGQKVALDMTDDDNIIVKAAVLTGNTPDVVIGVSEESVAAAAAGTLCAIRITAPVALN